LIDLEDDTFHIEALKKSYKQFKDNIPKVRSNMIQKKIHDWNESIINVQKGEKKINEACVHLTENLRDIVANKKQVYEKLTKHTDMMKDKISHFDDLNKKIHNVNQMIAEKEQDVLGDNRKNQLSKTIEKLKVWFSGFKLIIIRLKSLN
jgi:chromosome segregation ATPase